MSERKNFSGTKFLIEGGEKGPGSQRRKKIEHGKNILLSGRRQDGLTCAKTLGTRFDHEDRGKGKRGMGEETGDNTRLGSCIAGTNGAIKSR